MSIINPKNNLIFIRVPRTASTSIANVSFVGKGAHLRAVSIRRLMRKHIRGITFEEMFKFGFVRDPWDRLVSGYFYKKDNIDDKKGFNQFVENIDENGLHHTFYLVPQWRFLCDRKKNLLVDFVGRYENLQEDWRKVCSKLGFVEESLGVANKGNHKYYKEYYTKKSIERVAKIYKDDLEIFNYKY